MTKTHSSEKVPLWRKVLSGLAEAPPTGLLGLVVLFTYLFVIVFAPWLAPFGEATIVADAFAPWSAEHLLGTDSLGRDIYSRLIYAARNTVGITLMATLLAFVIGGALGMVAAVVGGWVDQVLSRLVDMLMAIPLLIFALLLLMIFGSSVTALILILGCLEATRVFRLTRAVAMNVAVMDYVEAARLRGEKMLWIIRREILPNILSPLFAEFGLRFCFIFLLVSSLSFLGLGLQPPTADWGAMVRENAMLITFGRVTPLLPAAAIAILTIAVNLVVDWFTHKASGLSK
ncbi:ABC transporter permease [Marinobacter piscensis]|uniref:ABC transporter permease n=1 Tax=Marinobacter piscensis TaxID=1562308 RepID=UPI0011A0366A|nr:ABC transporter permease [Marinobacter piscensis]